MMSIAEQLERAITSHAGVSPTADQRLDVKVTVASGELSCSLVGLDQWSCQVAEVRWLPSSAQVTKPLDLPDASRRLGKRLHYLLEPVSLVEFDPQAALLQMRSTPPTRDESRCCYYELVARAEEWKLLRYEKVPGHPRRPIAMALTREVLQRLAQDLVTTATE